MPMPRSIINPTDEYRGIGALTHKDLQDDPEGVIAQGKAAAQELSELRDTVAQNAKDKQALVSENEKLRGELVTRDPVTKLTVDATRRSLTESSMTVEEKDRRRSWLVSIGEAPF